MGSRCWDCGDSVWGLGVGTRGWDCGDSVWGRGAGVRCGDAAVPGLVRTQQNVSVCVRMCQCVQIMCQNESDSINKDKILFQNTYSALTIQCRL